MTSTHKLAQNLRRFPDFRMNQKLELWQKLRQEKIIKLVGLKGLGRDFGRSLIKEFVLPKWNAVLNGEDEFLVSCLWSEKALKRWRKDVACASGFWGNARRRC